MIKKLMKLVDLIGSTEGEDKIILADADGFVGTYLDIGCSNPIKDSNTFRLYMAGWRGVCVDIRKIRRYKWYRPRDRFMQATITRLDGWMWDYDLLNIDIDGIDLEVLKTLDYHPKWIIAETCMPSQREITDYLCSIGYKVIGQTTRNHIFKLEG